MKGEVQKTISDQVDEFLATQVAQEKDDIILEALTKHTGVPITLTDVAGRVTVTVFPDGSEVYSFDGKAVLRWMPLELDHTMDETGNVTINAKMNYAEVV